MSASQIELAPNASVKPKMSLEQRMLGIMAAFAVTWGLLCLILFTLSLTTDSAELAERYNPAQVQYLLATPAWVIFAKAMTAIGMLCGSVYLLLRRRSAYHWFMISLFGTLLVMFDSILRGGFEILGGIESGVNVGIVLVCVFLFWASYSALDDGQLYED
jgi:hypothetical protein